MVLMSTETFGGALVIQNQGFDPILSANFTDGPDLPTELLVLLIPASCYPDFKS
jgi:hypothetical protein